MFGLGMGELLVVLLVVLVFFGGSRLPKLGSSIGEAINNQNLRLAEIPKHERTQAMLQTLTYADVEEFKIGASTGQQGIGFRIGGK